MTLFCTNACWSKGRKIVNSLDALFRQVLLEVSADLPKVLGREGVPVPQNVEGLHGRHHGAAGRISFEQYPCVGKKVELKSPHMQLYSTRTSVVEKVDVAEDLVAQVCVWQVQDDRLLPGDVGKPKSYPGFLVNQGCRTGPCYLWMMVRYRTSGKLRNDSTDVWISCWTPVATEAKTTN